MQHSGIGNQRSYRERSKVAQDMSLCEHTNGTLHECLTFQFDQNLKDIQFERYTNSKLCSVDVIAQEYNITWIASLPSETAIVPAEK